VEGQEFADIEAYGVQRWPGELALAFRQETYRPAPIRRVFIPKSNGKLRPLGISTLRDRGAGTDLRSRPSTRAVCLPPGRNAQQAVVEVGGLLHRGHPEVVDADLADYFGSIPHAELVKSHLETADANREAEAHFDRSIELDPRFASAKISRLHVGQGANWAKAFGFH
jgi:RNA-directed DNA polymerase